MSFGSKNIDKSMFLLYIAGLPCPACKATDTEPKGTYENNGIMGPGYASWATDMWMSCKNCGIRFDPVSKSIIEKLLDLGARRMGSIDSCRQQMDLSSVSPQTIGTFLYNEGFTHNGYGISELYLRYKSNFHPTTMIDFDNLAGFMIVHVIDVD